MKRFLTLAVALCLATPACFAEEEAESEKRGGLVGIWDTPRLRITFTSDGYMIVVSQKTKIALSVSTFEMEGDTVSFQDITPIYFLKDATKECTTTKPGAYRVVEVGGTYMLSTQDDPCAGRVEVYEQLIMSKFDRPKSGKHD